MSDEDGFYIVSKGRDLGQRGQPGHEPLAVVDRSPAYDFESVADQFRKDVMTRHAKGAVTH